MRGLNGRAKARIAQKMLGRAPAVPGPSVFGLVSQFAGSVPELVKNSLGDGKKISMTLRKISNWKT
jgi:hypothetical protein